MANEKEKSEYMEQVELFAWARSAIALKYWPDLDVLEGSLNGVRLHPAIAQKAKLTGMLKGSHDIRLPVRRGSYVGLSIELKVGKNKPTAEQLWYGERLAANGWAVYYCWGMEQAKEAIIAYLALQAPGPTAA